MQVNAYHQRTKHHLNGFAAGPDTLDWDAQPAPFRDWGDAPQIPLELAADTVTAQWPDLDGAAVMAPSVVCARSIGILLELSYGLTAWKRFGPDRWSLRANPSSGNLHPTEVYVIVVGLEDLADGVYHYDPYGHRLARRALWSHGAPDAQKPKGLWIGLSSIQWREAWKYGERAFRYCQLDVGHALGSLRYAAAALGWRAQRVRGVSHGQISEWLGLDRAEDFGLAELEEPEMLIWVGADGMGSPALSIDAADWYGHASRIDPRPMYRWPVIDEVSLASRLLVGHADAGAERLLSSPNAPCGETGGEATKTSAVVDIIRGRRSAQHFDRLAQMDQRSFECLAQAMVPLNAVPWDAWPHSPRVHLILYVHRVQGLEPGVYVLPRSQKGEQLLREEIKAASSWRPCMDLALDDQGDEWRLWQIAQNSTLAGVLRQLSCHQAIASDACFAVSMVAEYDETLNERSDGYRLLLQESGLIGQALYLHAEAHGYRGTGIGCYFDDAVHQLLAIEGERLQVLYHFTVGVPVQDERISTEPPYAHLDSLRMERTP